MKKLSILFILCATCSLASLAQRSGMPPFVEFSGSGINLRKAPNTTAPTLLFGCWPESDDCYLIWSNDPDRRKMSCDPVKGNTGDVMLFLGEYGDFYKLAYSRYDYEWDYTQTYAAKQYLRKIEPIPVTASMVENLMEAQTLDFQTADGKTQKLFFRTISSPDVCNHIEMGLVGAENVFSYGMVAGFLMPDNSVPRMKIQKDGGQYCVKYGAAVTSTIAYKSKDGDWEEETLDVQKLRPEEVNALLKIFATANGEYKIAAHYYFFSADRHVAVPVKR